MVVKMEDSKKWIQIKAKCDRKYLDDVSAVMEMLDNGLMIEDYSDVDSALDGVYGDLIDESILNADKSSVSVSVFLPESKYSIETVSILKGRFAELGIEAEIECDNLNEDDWANSWKKYYKPIRTGKRLVIVPVWEKYEKKEDDVVVLMDPGMAFGTGTHETTRLCAALLEKYINPGDKELDVGCGSGILAICASKLGAEYCFACDIDPQAIKVAKENTELNKTNNVKCEVSDLVSRVELLDGGFDIATVNIVADVIIRLSPDIGRYLKPGAIVIVSGIIVERAEETVAALNKAGFTVVDDVTENGWYAAALKYEKQ